MSQAPPAGPATAWPATAGRIRLRLDARTKLVLVLGVALVMSLPAPEPYLPTVGVLVVVLLAGQGAWGRLTGFAIGGVLLALLGYGLPHIAPHPVTGVISYTCAYLLRFLLAAAVATHLVTSTSPSQLTAGLRAARAPRAVVVPLAVTLRFLPVVATETKAVWEAMGLRGLAGPRDLLRHPLRSIELLTVPAIASTLRVGDDLAASALLRGLGSRRRPTSIHPATFRVGDAVLLAVTGAALVGTWWLAR